VNSDVPEGELSLRAVASKLSMSGCQRYFSIVTVRGVVATQVGVNAENLKYCVIQDATSHFLVHVLQLEGKKEGYLFQYPIGTPITRSQFIAVLNAALVLSGLSPSVYKSHSFRIDSCTWHMQHMQYG
jgi:hypothetical protein